ncbi:hypothetical protein PLEOSDRAFT_165925 [Pleurotus ostreatus PC15]|uniref:VIT domain-containing protein n=1 Tax=Pleurotus ostreatus (strain PC15) TaxID=1137138 RepID=A0A067NTS9_PLEO1|nr:hypothetical protein PLEOSDRAFT_165925 [Pleurotus ostreatus PC15]
MDRYSGIVHNAGRTDGTKVYLPLEEVRVHTLLLDARKSDGTVIVSKCMDKDLAAERHERAIRDGKFTGLLETVTDDVFTISVGSIPAQERIEIKVVEQYVMTLLNDDNVDEIRFQLPQHVGDRYGTPPAALNDAAGTSTSTRIRISIDIQTSGRLHSVISPSHGHDIKEKRYPTHRNRTSRRRTTVTYRSKMYLSKDFLLIIHAEGLDAPRCFVEVARKTSRLGSDTIAFHLTMVPKSMLPPLPCQEYLFLIDRSGSMTGNRVETAKETLVTLLKLLPAQGTQFNLYSFGSTKVKKRGDMNSSNSGSKPVFDLSNWFLPARSADRAKTENRAGPTASFDVRNAATEDEDDDDDDYHSTSDQPTPTPKIRARARSTQSEDGGLSNFTFQATLDRIKARNQAGSNRTEPFKDREPPPHTILQQSTLPFPHSTTNLAGTKRKDKSTGAPASASPATAATPKTNLGTPTCGMPCPPRKRAKIPTPDAEADTPLSKATKHLRDAGMLGLMGKIDLRTVTNALFRVAARSQDTGTSELLYALATVQDELLLQQVTEQVTHTLRDAAKEISGNLTKKLTDLTKETVTAVRQGVIKAGRELDKCTDVVKVATGDLKATAESTPKSYAGVVSAGAPAPSAPALIQPATQARMERDRRRILIDPPAGRTQLYPTTVGNLGITKKATEALHQVGGESSWTFVSCIKLEKGGVLLEANSAEVKDWLATGGHLTNFMAVFSPGAIVKEKKYTIKALYLPVDQSIDTDEARLSVEKENGLPPNAITLIKWMKPAERRGKNQQYGHATITFTSPKNANLILRQGLTFLDTNYRCHKSKTEPLRCLKCQVYGHIASACAAPLTTCATCAQHHDNVGDCPQLNRKEAHACVTCRIGGHASWERSCPGRLKLQKMLDERLEGNCLPFFPTEEPWTQRRSPFYSGRVSNYSLADCDWRQSKKDRLLQTTLPDIFKPLVTATRTPSTIYLDRLRLWALPERIWNIRR